MRVYLGKYVDNPHIIAVPVGSKHNQLPEVAIVIAISIFKMTQHINILPLSFKSRQGLITVPNPQVLIYPDCNL